MVPELKLAELLCTRLCHDLTGPIGALANGAEFLSDEGFDLQGQAVDLIHSSASQAVSRLQFYRKAYGRISDDGEADLSELKKVVEDFFAGSKVTLDWPDTHTAASGVSVSYKMGRVLLNLVIIASATLLRGGTLSIRIKATESEKGLELLAKGISIKWDKETESALEGKIALEHLDPKTSQSELTRLLVAELSGTLSWNMGDGSAEFHFRQPIDKA